MKVGVMSDVHILPMYSAEVNNTCYCSVGCAGQNKFIPLDMQSNEYAPLGRLYCDPPQQLTEYMIKKLKLEQPDLDVLIITGDIVGHTYSQDLNGPYNPASYATLMQVHKNFSTLFAKEFPQTLLLPTFGNNDFQFHYQAPNVTDRQAFYSSIYNNWFVDNAFNAAHLDQELVRTTFFTGGYYRVNLNQNVSVLAFNSLVWSNKNRDIKDDGGQQEAMLNWLEDQLSTAESWRKFILTNHIYFGV
jgi:predicted phosphodiesterase